MARIKQRRAAWPALLAAATAAPAWANCTTDATPLPGQTCVALPPGVDFVWSNAPNNGSFLSPQNYAVFARSNFQNDVFLARPPGAEDRMVFSNLQAGSFTEPGETIPGFSLLRIPNAAYTVTFDQPSYQSGFLGVANAAVTFQGGSGTAYGILGDTSVSSGTLTLSSLKLDLQVGGLNIAARDSLDGRLTVNGDAKLASGLGTISVNSSNTVVGFPTAELLVKDGGKMESQGLLAIQSFTTLGGVSTADTRITGTGSSLAGHRMTINSINATAAPGDAALIVQNGGHASFDASISVANLIGSTGRIDIGGTGSKFSFNPVLVTGQPQSTLLVGNVGFGRLSVHDNATAELKGVGAIADGPAFVGPIFGNQPGSIGVLEILSGGKVSTPALGAFGSNQLVIGNAGQGEALISGAGSSLTGDASTATLLIGNLAAGSTSTMNVTTGGSVSDFRHLLVGNEGAAVLTISNGGKVQAGEATLGNKPTGAGTISVDGANSSLTVGENNGSGRLAVGREGSGVVNVTGGARINLSGVPGESGLTIGEKGTANGQVFIAGQGSAITSTGETTLTMAAGTDPGVGKLTIRDNASAEFFQGYIGVSGEATGQGAKRATVLVDTGGQLKFTGALGQLGDEVSAISGQIDVRIGGQADVRVEGGGKFIANTIVVQPSGTQSVLDTASLQVSGANSKLDVQQDLYVLGGPTTGNQGGVAAKVLATAGGTVEVANKLFVGGRGLVEVSDGGKLDTLIAKVGVPLGGVIGYSQSQYPTVAEVLVQGQGSTWNTASLAIGGTFTDQSTGQSLVSKGTVIVRDGGHLVVGGIIPGAGTILVDKGGTLLGCAGGLVSGTVVKVTGSVAPGCSAGKLTIDADLFMAPTGVLEIEIGGTEQGVDYDLLEVLGQVHLGGTLRLIFLNGFVPDPDDLFEFLHASGGFDGTFAGLEFSGIGTIPQVDLRFGPNGILLALPGGGSGGGDGGAAGDVPEPASLTLLAIGMVGLAWRRSRRRPQ